MTFTNTSGLKCPRHSSSRVSHGSPLRPLLLLFLLAKIVFIEQDIPLQRQQWLLCHCSSKCFLMLGQYHGAEQGRVGHVTHRRLRERLKVLKLLLYVFRNQAPVMVHHPVHFLDLALCLSCKCNNVVHALQRTIITCCYSNNLLTTSH